MNPVAMTGQDSAGKQEAIKSTSGAAHVSPQNSAAWIWPSSWFVNHSGTATGTADNTVVMETNDVSMYNHHEFSIVTAPGASAVEVLVSHDGTNYEAVAIQVFDRALVEGAVVQGLAQLTAIGNYYFNGKYTKWKIQNNGITAANTVVRGSSSVA